MTTDGGASRSTEPAAGTSSATDVSLREYVTAAIRYERQAARSLSITRGSQRSKKFQNKLLGAIALSAVFVPLLTAFIVYALTRHSIPTGGK